jgi:hypothetical protein
MKLIKALMADLANQIWTFVGLFSAWLVLTGSAKTVVGDAILISVFLWIVTFRLRVPKSKDEDKPTE